MPKPVDEDRARRKELLDQKKVARKAAAAAAKVANDEKNAAAAAIQASVGVVGTAESTTSSLRGTCCDKNHDTEEDMNTVDGGGTHQPLPVVFTGLPLDAMHVIYSMLCAADVGRLISTYNIHLYEVLVTARTSYLLSRLLLLPSRNGDHLTTTHNSCWSSQPSDTTVAPIVVVSSSSSTQHAQQPLLQLCTSEQAARDLLVNALVAGGDTGRATTIVAATKAVGGSKNRSGTMRFPLNNNSRITSEVLQFVGYARFLEEAVSGYSMLWLPQPNQRHSSNTSTTDNTSTRIHTTIRLPTLVQGRWASASPEHTLCRVGGDGIHCGPCSGVASWGVGKRGQLGHGQRSDAMTPLRLRGGMGYRHPQYRIVQVAAGGGLVRVAHSLLLTSTGRVLSFGTGQYGALGHGYSAAKQLPDYLSPTLIEGLAHVVCVCVAAGELHSAAVTADGDVFTWGDGFCGQLGHGDKRPVTVPVQVTTGGLDDECVANISCGSRHTLAVTEDGECYSWGLGHFGVLGRSYTPFEYDADADVVNLAAAGAVDDPAAAAVAGLRAVLQPQGAVEPNDAPIAVPRDVAAELAAHLDLIANLTLDDASDQCIPKVIDSLQGIRLVGASAGHRHSLLLAADGGLYSFGAGNSGCLGHGDTQSHMYPCRIQAFDEINGGSCTRIRQMSAGVDMSMAVSTAGHVFAWGKTDGGRIGLGMAKMQVTLPRRVYLTAPPHDDDNDESSLSKAVDVECGYVHSIIVGLNGTIHVCGGVGVDGADDGQEQLLDEEGKADNSEEMGRPRLVDDFYIWHRTPEPRDEQVKKERWQKLGKYEVKGRSKNVNREV